MRAGVVFVVCAMSCSPTPSPSPDPDGCRYDRYEGTCVLTDVWVEPPGDAADVVRIEAQYTTPKGREIVRYQVPPDEVETVKSHLAKHARVGCRGGVIAAGTCEPSTIELDLPPW